MKIKVIGLFIGILLIALCLIGCKDTKGNILDTSSDTKTTSSVPIVIIDDQNESNLDEIIDNWEENNPTVNIEIDPNDKGDSSNSFDNNSENNSLNDNSNSSPTEDSSENNSVDNGSDNSSNSDDSNDASEDDGYFDVAV